MSIQTYETAAHRMLTFRNCFEAAMDFDTALGCAGMSELDETTIAQLKAMWNAWEAAFYA
jgi:hypothetical protein